MAWSLQIVSDNEAVYEFHDPANGRALQRLNGRGFPAIDRYVVEPATLDGSVFKGARYGQRLLEVVHVVQGESYSDLMERRLQLAEALTPKSINVDGALATLRWREEVDRPTYEIDVQIAGSVPLDGNVGLNTEQYSIPLVADNPLWRKVPATITEIELTTSGITVPISVPISVSSGTTSTTATNSGNAISYPTITITAGSSGAENPRITNLTTNEKIQINYPMQAGDVIVIDMQNRSAILNGTTSVIRYRTVDSVSWGLVVGSNTIEGIVGSGGATFALTHNDLFAAV